MALLGLATPERLSPKIRRAADLGPRFLSVVSYWEVLLKSMKGKLDVGDPRMWWLEAKEAFAAAPVLLRPEHVSAVYGLAPIHQDPFDRILIAQALSEDLTLLSTDIEVAKYASKRVRLID